jgi:hypothetical protein
MKEKSKEDRLKDIKAFKELNEKLEIQNEYRELAEKALVDPRSFSFYFISQQAEFIVEMYKSVHRAPFRAIEAGFDAWVEEVSNPRNTGYLYVLKKNNKLEVDYYRIRRDFPIK